MKKLAIMALAVLTAFTLTACGSKPSDGGKGALDTIIVGTNAEFPPFEYINEEGEPDGFDIALMKAIGEKIGAEVTVSNMEFKSLIGAIEMDSIDAIAAGMTRTEDREKSVDFSESYYEAKQVIVVAADSTVAGFADLEGGAIAVQEGTTGDFMVSPEEDGAVLTNATVKRFKKGADAINDLKNGAVDAVVIDAIPAQEFVAMNSDSLKIVTDDSVEPEFYAIAVKKGNKELLDAINKALVELKEDGTYDKLLDEYINN